MKDETPRFDAVSKMDTNVANILLEHGSGAVIFQANGKDVIRLNQGKFIYNGEEVEDTNKAYENFCEWLGYLFVPEEELNDDCEEDICLR